MRFIGTMNVYSKSIDKLQDKMEPLFDLLYNIIHFHGKNETKKLFQQMETSVIKDVAPTLGNTNHLFFVTVDFPFIVIGCVLF